MFLNPTNPDEIIKITQKRKASNSCGIDYISNKLHKLIILKLNVYGIRGIANSWIEN